MGLAQEMLLSAASLLLASFKFNPAANYNSPYRFVSARNMAYLLLNDLLQQVPDNTIASLYLGGDDLADGYWNQPSLTAEKFLPDPFFKGERIDTGDLAKSNILLMPCC